MMSCQRVGIRPALLTVALTLCACETPGKGSSSQPTSAKSTPTTSGVVSASLAASASAKPVKPAALNVIVIVIDSLRADRMPFSGYKHDVAPRLQEFAKSAVTYTRFYSLSSYTSMTFGGFMAARYPSEVKRSGYFFSAYPDEQLMFPELLQRAGVRTMAGLAHWYFNKNKAGLHQGFDLWDIVPGLKKSNTTDENITSEKHLALALAQLRKSANTSKRFFAFHHFLDPHDMYMGHKGTPKFRRGARGMYDGEIHYTDKHVGKLLDFIDAQPWGKRTAIIITADHGETFGEHGMYRHGFELWQELIHVPLFIRVPGLAARTIKTPRGGIDLPPTIFELLGVKPDDSFQGTSLVAELRSKEEPVQRAVISDLPRTSDNDKRRALIWGKHKLIAFGDNDYYKLFDVEADPREKRDLASKDKELLEKMIERLDEASKHIKDICPKMRSKLKGKKKKNPC